MLVTSPSYGSSDYHLDHIYAQAKFKKIDDKQKGEIELYKRYENSLANLQLLYKDLNIIKTDDDYVDWKANQNIRYTQVMLIPDLDDYRFDNFITFVERREELLVTKLAQILKVEN